MGKEIKRIVALSDGTWQALDSQYKTNIVRLAKAISHEDAQGIEQVIYYDPGVGTGSGTEALTGGAMGVGIDHNIQQLYTFIALNYNPGDEVYLFGFSRGSYTVRSLVGLIYTCGLLRREHIDCVQSAYELYREHVKHYEEKAVKFRKTHSQEIDITLLACFDTVAALGMPTSLFSSFDDKRYGFHDAHLHHIVKNAIHCLSIDEMRTTYKPTLMYHHKDMGPNQLTQKWFWGEHAGVGGGDDKDPLASDVSLKFMVDEMKNRKLGLEIIMDRMPRSLNLTAKQHVVPLTLVMRFQRMFGVAPRDIETLDDVHESVFKRIKEVPEYRPKSLERFINAIITGNKE